jgi:hypothetical protein
MTTAEFQELLGAGMTFSSYEDYSTAKEAATRAVERERERCARIAEEIGNEPAPAGQGARWVACSRIVERIRKAQ